MLDRVFSSGYIDSRTFKNKDSNETKSWYSDNRLFGFVKISRKIRFGKDARNVYHKGTQKVITRNRYINNKSLTNTSRSVYEKETGIG